VANNCGYFFLTQVNRVCVTLRDGVFLLIVKAEPSGDEKDKDFDLTCKCNVYSCFEKGWPTKPYATMPKDIMGNGSSCSLIDALGVSTT